ncbi:MAG: hypothetical protein K6A92_12825 [Lachnospiraceae bacterium]|nr:hypothetical protein [Lachnospiraceae bacterium]
MENRKCFYLVEGECEEKLLKALKGQPALIKPGSVKKFNAVQNEIPASRLMAFDPGSRVVLVFDTDKEVTEHLERNIQLLKTVCSKVEVLTIAQVFNFEDEMIRSTDVSKAEELTKSETVSDMKKAVNRMKEIEFRQALRRHKFELSKLWIKNPPKAFSFVKQQAELIKVEDKQ